MAAAPAESPVARRDEIPGAALPLAALAALVRGVEAGDDVEGTLAELRAAWPGLDPGDRRLLGRLVTGLL
ncbi:MAG: hypothetical protein ACAH79_11710, partial [Thermoleophilia bacterium]